MIERVKEIVKHRSLSIIAENCKIEKSNLTLTFDEDTPFFEEANTVLICRKLLATDLGEQDFIDKKIIKDIYKANDFHTLYIAEIEKVLVKEN